jgi:type III secretion protein R
MKLPNIFSLKFLVALIIGLAILWLPPQHIYSQQSDHNSYLAAATTPNTISQTPTTPTTPRTSPATTAPKPGVPTPDDITPSLKGAPSMLTQAAVLSLLSLLPFVVMILTSFLKIVIVLSLLRTALGVNQAPPNAIINGVGFMLSIFIMYPTGLKMYKAAEAVIELQAAPETLTSKESPQYIMAIVAEAREPLRDFLRKNSSVKHQKTFYRTAYRIIPEENRESLKPEDFMILVPSFITSQLKDAFEIGVLIYIPFFVIDLVTSNILLAMGMMMLSPVTISMPLKLFLLVMLDGWTLLIEGLVNTFVQ